MCAVLKESTSPSAHWYTRDGKTCHTMSKADGEGSRPTTLADARKLGLFPSVSSILALLDKPGLDKWKQEQVAIAAIAIQRTKGESDEYLIDRIIDASRAIVKKASDFGTGVHGELERYFKAKMDRTEFAPNATTFSHSKGAIEFLEAKRVVPVANEVVVINGEHGFGGTSDLPCKMMEKFLVHVDYKTKKTNPGEPIEAYPDQAMQIAAYGATYWKEQFAHLWGLNIFISSTEPGRVEVALYSPQQLQAEWVCFQMLCHLWRHINQYDPRYPITAQPVFYSPKMVVVSGPGGSPIEAPVVKSGDTPPPPPPPLPPEARADHPAKGPTMLQVIETAVLTQNECDGIKFLSPRDCCAIPASKTDYAWWWHEETKTARVSIRNDGSMHVHGWHNAFLAYPADARNIAKSEKAPAATPPPVVKPSDPLPLKEVLRAKAAPPPASPASPKRATKPEAPGAEERKLIKDNKARIAEIEAMPITFGKFKSHAKIKKIGDLPDNYLDYLRDVENIPAHVAEYICYTSISKRIDKSLK